MNIHQATQSYKKNTILTSSPEKIILMLFDGALKFLKIAKEGFNINQISKKIEVVNNNILKAQSIIAELQASLDLTVEGDFAKTMYQLYDYMYALLQKANLQKDLQPIIETETILTDIRNAWDEMIKKLESNQPSDDIQKN